MSDSKRATLITVGAPKSEKKKVTNTVRLTINLDESNESKYPELNYKELVRAAEKKQKTQNGKTGGLDPFSDNDDDVERVARKFEQKYGSKSTYGSKGRTKHDEFADIGAGYDENDSFIDNTDGYDEMMPPDCDTLYGGFYINCGSLEFKAVANENVCPSDGETAKRHNKRRISSSSSEDDSSESSSEPESPDEKDPKATLVNGNSDSHKTEHRMKSKKLEKSKAKRLRSDSPTATSGKQTTSDENNHGDAESADSGTSRSDSLTSKPAPSSENVATSDSSRDAPEVNFPSNVSDILDEMSGCMTRLRALTAYTANDFESATDPLIIRLQNTLWSGNIEARLRRSIWNKASQILSTKYNPLVKRARGLVQIDKPQSPVQSTNSVQPVSPELRLQSKPENTPKINIRELSEAEREQKTVEILERLKALVEEKRPSIMHNYKLECERVQEERKRLKDQQASGGSDVPQHVERRLPKRRFPWCARSRGYLHKLTQLAGDETKAALLLAQRALPLFPSGFVRMPTLLRQANLNRDLSAQIKPSDLKKTISLPPQPAAQSAVPAPATSSISEPIHFPSSLTVTTTVKTAEKHEIASDTNEDEMKKKKHKNHTKEPLLASIFGSVNLPKDLIVESNNKENKDMLIIEKVSERPVDTSKYVNNSAGFTITPVPAPAPKQDTKSYPSDSVTADNKKEQTIRVKSQASLSKEADDIAKNRTKTKAPESSMTPLFVETSFKDKKVDSKSPASVVKPRADDVLHKKIDNLRISEAHIPTPGLIPVHVSPTFTKPDKRAPDFKKTARDETEVHREPIPADDSSSDVELVGVEILSPAKDNRNNSVVKNPSDSKIVQSVNWDKPNSTKVSDKASVIRNDSYGEKMDIDQSKAVQSEEIHKVIQNLKEMQDSQDRSFANNFNSVITSTKRMKASSNSVDIFDSNLSRNNTDKLASFFEQNGWM